MDNNRLSGWFSLIIETENSKHTEISKLLGLEEDCSCIRKNNWIHTKRFNDINDLNDCIEKIINKVDVKNIITAKKLYNDVYFSLYLQSDYAQINFFIFSQVIKRLSVFDIDLNISILS